MVSYPSNSKPHINWDHIDGPLLVTRDGQLRWLTIMDRVKLLFSMITVEDLDKKYRSRND